MKLSDEEFIKARKELEDATKARDYAFNNLLKLKEQERDEREVKLGLRVQSLGDWLREVRSGNVDDFEQELCWVSEVLTNYVKKSDVVARDAKLREKVNELFLFEMDKKSEKLRNEILLLLEGSK